MSVFYEGYDTFINGGAIGFDIFCGLVVSELKKTYPHIKLITAIPFVRYSSSWNDKNKQMLNGVLNESDDLIVVSNKTNKKAYFERNDWMIDNSSYCIGFVNINRTGGSVYTFNKAKSKGLKTLNMYI